MIWMISATCRIDTMRLALELPWAADIFKVANYVGVVHTLFKIKSKDRVVI